MNLYIAIFLVFFEAAYEGLAFRGKKTLSGVVELIYLAFITVIVFSWSTGNSFVFGTGEFFYVIIGYVLFRFAIFDLVLNPIAGWPIFYIGNTKLSDKGLYWLATKGKVPVGFVLFLKFIAFVWGVAWLLGWQHGIK